jgi:hypothetical protein
MADTITAIDLTGTARTVRSLGRVAQADGDLAPAIFLFKPLAEGGNVATMGGQLVLAGTASVPVPAAGSLLSSAVRLRYAPPSTAAGTATTFRTQNPAAPFWRGNAAGLGGFRVRVRWGYTLSNLAGHRAFVGLMAATGNVLNTGDPSAQANIIGVGFDAANAVGDGWQILRNDGAGTAPAVPSGIARNNTSLLELLIVAEPNASSLTVELRDLSLGTTSGELTYTTELPDSATFLGFRAEVSTGTLAGSTAPALDYTHASVIREA